MTTEELTQWKIDHAALIEKAEAIGETVNEAMNEIINDIKDVDTDDLIPIGMAILKCTLFSMLK